MAAASEITKNTRLVVPTAVVAMALCASFGWMMKMQRSIDKNAFASKAILVELQHTRYRLDTHIERDVVLKASDVRDITRVQ